MRGDFLKGPVPMQWLEQAGRLPGKALHVGVLLWFEAGRRRDRTVPLAGGLLAGMRVERRAGYRALAQLEAAGLVSAVRGRGRCPRVTLLALEPDSVPQPSAGEAGPCQSTLRGA